MTRRSYVDKIRDCDVSPLVGDGMDGCLRSVQVIRDELATLARDDPRRPGLEAQADAWSDAADRQAREQELRR